MVKEFKNKEEILQQNAGGQTVNFQLKLGDKINVFVKR